LGLRQPSPSDRGARPVTCGTVMVVPRIPLPFGLRSSLSIDLDSALASRPPHRLAALPLHGSRPRPASSPAKMQKTMRRTRTHHLPPMPLAQQATEQEELAKFGMTLAYLLSEEHDKSLADAVFQPPSDPTAIGAQQAATHHRGPASPHAASARQPPVSHDRSATREVAAPSRAMDEQPAARDNPFVQAARRKDGRCELEQLLESPRASLTSKKPLPPLKLPAERGAHPVGSEPPPPPHAGAKKGRRATVDHAMTRGVSEEVLAAAREEAAKEQASLHPVRQREVLALLRSFAEQQAAGTCKVASFRALLRLSYPHASKAEINAMLACASSKQRGEAAAAAAAKARRCVIERLFDALDTAGRGTIDEASFIALVKQIDDRLDDADARAWFREADVDGSGGLDVDELDALVLSHGLMACSEEMIAAAKDTAAKEQPPWLELGLAKPAAVPNAERPSLATMNLNAMLNKL